MRPMKSLLSCATALALTGWVSAAHAQTEATTLIETSIPDNFDRGRNTSVLETPRPDYDPLGIQLGGFNLQPRAEIGLGASDNVYDLGGSGRRSDGFAYLSPQASLRSDWGKHEFDLFAGTTLQRYFKETPRNQTLFDLRSLGRVDLGSNYSVTGEAQYARQYESVDTGAIASNLSVLSSYQRSFFSVRGEYRAGQGRAILALDRTAFTFNAIDDPVAGRIDQSTRDRVVSRVTGQLQYAFTPSVSVYGQASVSDTGYSHELAPGVENRDSTSGRFIAGFNFDLAGLLRGKIGVGYAFRDYDSATFKNVSGFSVETKLEYFMTPLTTLTLAAGRTIEDASIGSTSAYFDNRVSLRVDHELLRNLLLNASGEYSHQSYIDLPLHADNWRFNAGATYLSSRFLRLFSAITYLHRRDNGTGLGSDFGELSGRVGVILTR